MFTHYMQVDYFFQYILFISYQIPVYSSKSITSTKHDTYINIMHSMSRKHCHANIFFKPYGCTYICFIVNYIMCYIWGCVGTGQPSVTRTRAHAEQPSLRIRRTGSYTIPLTLYGHQRIFDTSSLPTI